MATALRVLALIPVLVALGIAAAEVIDVGRADAIALRASREMGSWYAARIDPAEATWQSVREELARAEKLDASSPIIQELLGVLGARRLDRPEYVREGAEHFRKALERRPVSPYTWANLAEAKYNLGETDRQFETALARAVELGPAEPEVQRMVALYGLAVWDEVAPETRAAVERAVAAGVKRNPLEMLQIAGRRGRLPLACRHLVESPRRSETKWSRLCQGTEATS